MEKINIYEAKTHLSKIIQEVVNTGEPVMIAKNGKVMVKLVAYTEEKEKRKLGFMIGHEDIPDAYIEDFDQLNKKDIESLFNGDDL